jgi:ATP-dependent DNA helicase UvrD/PcrA
MSAKSHAASAFVPDAQQRAAIEHIHGPLLVIAGAGTGKTSVLTQRIARLVGEGHAEPGEVLGLTYTNNAANEMRERLCGLLGGKAVRATTFHDFCLNLLQSAGHNFDVLDEQDMWIYLRRRIRDLHLDHFVRAANVGQFLSDLLKFMDRCHDELVSPAKYSDYVARLERGECQLPRVAKSKNELPEDETLARCLEIARVFETVERWLKEDNLGTFSHMIVRAHALLESDPEALTEARMRSRFILADEFQDANFAQVKILSRLSGAEGNVFAVGDPDQSIYRFRGASSAAFELFRRQFPSSGLVVLDKNRRSTTPILRSAFALIQENPPAIAGRSEDSIRYHRTPLVSARDEEATSTGAPPSRAKVECIVLTDKDSEGPEVAGFIRDLQKKSKCKWSDIGVLYRSHWHRDDLVEKLGDGDIPFVIERLDISRTPEALDLFACLRAVVDSGDDVSLFRVASRPHFHVDPRELRQALRAIARESREGAIVPLSSALDRVSGGAEVAEALRTTREEIRRRGVGGRPAVEILLKYMGFDKNSAVISAILRFVGNWEQKKKMNRNTSLEELADYLEYFEDANGVIPQEPEVERNAVRLMTVHSAKGLEFRHVLILRANSNSFPSSYKETLVEFPKELRDPDSMTEDDDRELSRQEERRLFYVAMTRARDSLHIYSKQGRGKNKNPDGYMRELIENRALEPWFVNVGARGAQENLDMFGAAAYPAESKMGEWFDLPVLPGLDARLSASAIDTYERCGLQFKLDRDWKLPGEPAAAMQFGASMHRVLKTYYDSIRLGRPKTEAEVLALFRGDLAEAKIQEAYQHELYEKLGTAQLHDHLASQSKREIEVLHTEETFEVRVGATLVAGRMDRIDRLPDGSVMIVDYKTGRARDQKAADESLQLSLYAIAATEKWGYRVGALALHNLEDDVSVITTRSEADLVAARERVKHAAEGIAAEDFPIRTGPHCNFCAYRNLCPKQERRIPLRVLSDGSKE